MEFSFLEYLILILIGLLFFKEQMIQWVGKKFGFKNGNGHPNNNELSKQIAVLQDNHVEHLSDSVRETHECMREIKVIVRELKEYGIKCRK